MLTADKILTRFQALEEKRSHWEGAWQQCADFLLPRLGKDNRSSNQIFDSTAPVALGHFAAALESFLSPRAEKWHTLTAPGKAAKDDPAALAWLENLRDLLFTLRYAPEANFADQIMEAYISLGLYGTAVIYVEEDLERGLRYRNVPIHEVYLAEDSVGRVDTVFRWYKLTARQAWLEFGPNLPEDIQQKANDPRHMEEEHEFIHGVFPRREMTPDRTDALNLPIASVHVAKAARLVVRESGFRVMPYAVSRFTVSPGEVYGRSPAMEVMADIVQVNAMKKSILRAAEKMVNPPLLTPEDDLLSAFSLKAGSINYGGLDEQGRQRVVPLQLNGNLPIGLELIEQGRKAINEAFYVNLFQTLLESPQKTATEVLERAAEKAQLLGPAVGRQQSELLRVIITRELDILLHAGALTQLPPPPPSLAQNLNRFQPKYETTLSQALENKEGQAILNALVALGQVASFEPKVAGLIDGVAAGRNLWRSFGAPAELLRQGEPQIPLSLSTGGKAAQGAAASGQNEAESGGFLTKIQSYLSALLSDEESLSTLREAISEVLAANPESMAGDSPLKLGGELFQKFALGQMRPEDFLGPRLK